MEVIDNFLSEEDFNALSEIVMGVENFSWFCSPDIAYEADYSQCFFYHTFFADMLPRSDYYVAVRSLFLDKIPNVRALLRLRACCYVATENVIEHGSHRDYDEGSEIKGAILYMNDCNGFTRLSDNEVVESKQNRLLLHDSTKMHNSTNCSDAPRRVVLVANYL